MSKQTDHKKLWRREKEKNVMLGNSYGTLRSSYQALVDMLNDLKSGKIKLSDIDTKVETDKVHAEEEMLLSYLKNKKDDKKANVEVNTKAESQNVNLKTEARQKVI